MQKSDHDIQTEEAPEVESLKAAFKAQLSALIEKPLTARSLLSLEQTARLAREVLAIGKDSRAISRQQPMGYMDDSAYGVPVSPLSPGELIQGPNPYRAETFGATMMRELIAAAQEFRKPKPTALELVIAIDEAHKRNMTEHEQVLRAELDSLLGKRKSEEKPVVEAIQLGVSS